MALINLRPLTNTSVMENQAILNENLQTIYNWLQVTLLESVAGGTTNTVQLIKLSKEIKELIEALDNVIQV